MIAIQLALIVANTWASDCVPTFYRSLPRDGEFYYGAGKGQDSKIARAEAVKDLALQVGPIGANVMSGIEQDDAAVCNGQQYVMVRVDRLAVREAIIADRNSKRQIADRLDDRLTGVEGNTGSLRSSVNENSSAIQEQRRMINGIDSMARAPINIYTAPGQKASLPTLQQRAAWHAKLDPIVNKSLDKIEQHDFNSRDVANVIVSYNTEGDLDSLGKFCSKVLSEEYDLGAKKGLRQWVVSQCAKAGK